MCNQCDTFHHHMSQSPAPQIPHNATPTPAFSSSPCGFGGRCKLWCQISALCVCGAGALYPWTSHSVTELARKEHSCTLIFICIAASWGHARRPWERQRHTDYKGSARERTGWEREGAQAGAGHLASVLRNQFLFQGKVGLWGNRKDKFVVFFNTLSSITAQVFLSELEDNGNDSRDTVYTT